MSNALVPFEKVIKARKNKVFRSTELINETSFILTPVENKALSFMISNISPDDPPDRLYTFDVETFKRAIMWGNDTSNQRIRAMIKNLADKSVWFHDEEKNKFILVRWLDTLVIDEKSGNVVYSFHKAISPYLFNLGVESDILYLGYEFEKTCVMQGMYSDRLYSIFKTYAFDHSEWVFLLDELKSMLINVQKKKATEVEKIIKKWDNYAIFYRNVLEKSIEEINKYTDLKVTVQPLKEDLQGKKYRKYVALKVTFTKKTDTEIREADAIIDELYRSSQPEYYQMSLTDYLDGINDTSSGRGEDTVDLSESEYVIIEKTTTDIEGKPLSREEAKRINTEKKERRERRLQELSDKFEGKYSKETIFAVYILQEQYENIYSDKECINMLQEAEKHVDIMRIREEDIVAWAIEYIKYYQDKISTSDIPTKYSEYGRIMKELRQDYDHIKNRDSKYYDLHLK